MVRSQRRAMVTLPTDIKPVPTTMITKHPFLYLYLALFGLPFLFLNLGVQAQDKANDETAAEISATQAAEEESGKAKRAKENSDRDKKSVEQSKEADKAATSRQKEEEKANARAAKAAERSKKNTKQPAVEPKQEDEKPIALEQAPEPASQPPIEKPEVEESRVVEKPVQPAEAQGRDEDLPMTRTPTVTRPAPESRDGRERTPSPGTTSTPTVPPDASIDGGKLPVDKEVPSTARNLREETQPRGSLTIPAKEEVAAPDASVDRITAEPPTTEPERLAETQVTEATREVLRDVDKRKARIEGREEAQSVINEILGAESRISRAEIAREERFRPRIQRERPTGEREFVVSPQQRREATTYFQQRLRGREIEGPEPEFFRRSERRGNRRFQQVEERFVRPQYLNEGRRYVHYDSRASIPAILMAAQAMNQVRFQPAPEIGPIFYGQENVEIVSMPPESYRTETSWVVSYPVDENSMISSEDILFLQGSTQFSDPYSYEVVGALADALKEMPEEDRFVIEGHASAEGTYESNMVLSQQRAEYIVREIVRRGVSPYRLLPVGYGESEARHPADAAEPLRGQDRRVVVFRMTPEPIAQR